MPTHEDLAWTNKCVRHAWASTVLDYEAELLNSEGALQASFYSHLRDELSKHEKSAPFRVLVAARIRDGKKKGAGSRIFVDILVEHEGVVLSAVELKYTPRGWSKSVEKDINSLAWLRRAAQRGATLELEFSRQGRYAKDGVTKLKVATHASKIVCMVCSAGAQKWVQDKKTFWSQYGPKVSDTDQWSRESQWPRYLGMLVALAPKGEGGTRALKLGRIFEVDDASVNNADGAMAS